MIYFPTMYTQLNKLFVLVFILINAVSLSAQDFDLTSMIFQEKGIEYMGQLDAAKQKYKNGMGILKEGGNVYFGDFINNKKSGYGMLVANKKGKIKNLKNCMVYIGSWFDGKKHGKGTCYDFNGKVIYHGIFEDDKPLSTYPSTASSSSYFSIIGLDGGAYIGELLEGVPNGYGIFIANNGELSFGKVKDGIRYSMGLILFSPHVWKAVKWEGDEYTEVTNSEVYKARAQATKEANDKFYSQIWAEFAGVAQGLSGVANQYVEYQSSKNGASTSSYSGSYSSSGSTSSSKNKSSVSSSKTSQDCGSAWQTDSRNYSNLETRAMNCANESEYKSIQSEMRRIREKWTSRGCHITKSEWETKPF